MRTKPTLFFSCVSDEFGKLRKRADFYLRRGDVEVRTQETFRQRGETTLEKLDLYLQDCEAVVHLIGAQAGAEVRPAAVEAYLKACPEFLDTYPDLRTSLGDCQGLTYTQWEAYLALHRGLTVHTYLPEGVDLSEARNTYERLLARQRIVDPVR